MVNIRSDISNHTYGLNLRKKLEISHLELEKQTYIAELVITLTVRIAIYATLHLFLVLAFLYKAIHSYHTFYRSNLHHYIYNLYKHFISVFVFIVSQLACKLNILTCK